MRTKILYVITFKKNGGATKQYQIPATSEMNAVARLGQIHGDDRGYREDLELEIIKVEGK
jgi:hypothetical protein